MSRRRKPRAWAAPEIQYLCDNYGKITAREIGSKIGRTDGTVRTKARALGLAQKAKEEKLVGGTHSRFRPGDRVLVTLPGIPGMRGTGKRVKGTEQRRHFGEVARLYERFILVNLDVGWRECVNLNTVFAGEASIEKC